MVTRGLGGHKRGGPMASDFLGSLGREKRRVLYRQGVSRVSVTSPDPFLLFSATLPPCPSPPGPPFSAFRRRDRWSSGHSRNLSVLIVCVYDASWTGFLERFLASYFSSRDRSILLSKCFYEITGGGEWLRKMIGRIMGLLQILNTAFKSLSLFLCDETIKGSWEDCTSF